jgi:hypothetical protein
MGKVNKLAAMEAQFGPNPHCLNEPYDLMKEYERAQKIVQKNKRYKTVILRRLRRIRRDMVAYQRRHLKLVAFGYWKYWFLEGKIGPEDDEEPNLVHK